jgi:hypothetical protein
MKKCERSREVKKSRSQQVALKGPSLFEVEYLRQMKEELEIFLKSRNFSTIQAFDIAFAGSDYTGHLRVSA